MPTHSGSKLLLTFKSLDSSRTPVSVWVQLTKVVNSTPTAPIFRATHWVVWFTRTVPQIPTAVPLPRCSTGTRQFFVPLVNSELNIEVVYSFVGGNQFCFKACYNSVTSPDYCENRYDLVGCSYNMPSAAKDGEFTSCDGALQDVAGVYSVNGVSEYRLVFLLPYT